MAPHHPPPPPSPPPPPHPPKEEQYPSAQEKRHHIILDDDDNVNNNNVHANGPQPTLIPTSNEALVGAQKAVGALVPPPPDGRDGKFFIKQSRLLQFCEGCARKRGGGGGGVDNLDSSAVALAAEDTEMIQLVAEQPAPMEFLKAHPEIVKAASDDEHPEVLEEEEEVMKHHDDVINRILEHPDDVSELLRKQPSFAIPGAALASSGAQDEDYQLRKRDVEFATGLAAEQEMFTRPTVLSVAPFHGFGGNVQLVPRTIVSDPTDNKCYILFVVGGLVIAMIILGIARIVNSCTAWRNRMQRASGSSVEPYGQERTKEETC